MTLLRAPRAPTDQLRIECLKTLAKLELIIEFRPWIRALHDHRKSGPDSPCKVLFDCFALGAPLGVLLDLLGSPAPNHRSVNVEDFDFNLSLPEREFYVVSFINRVEILEVQGRLSYGEVLRVEDVFNGTNAGLTKILKTVNRILISLSASYPGLFVVPRDARSRKADALEELLESERIHMEFLRTVLDSAAFLSCESKIMESRMESLVLNDTRLRQYHDRVLGSLHHLISKPWLENWETVFAFDEPAVWTNMASTYRSLCTNYVSLYEFLDEGVDSLEPVLAAHAQMLIDILCYIPTRISEYCIQLQNILSLTLPTSSELPVGSYDSLCRTILRMQDISTAIDEMSWQLRTMRSAHILQARAYQWQTSDRQAIDPSDLGTLLLDDQLVLVPDADQSSGQVVYQVFIFDAMLLCCTSGPLSRHQREREGREAAYVARYPIRAWEFGPALRGTAPLDLVHAIPTSEMRELRILDPDLLEIVWFNEHGAHTLTFRCTSGEAQLEQWCSVLDPFVSSVVDMAYSSEDDDDTDDGDSVLLSEDEGFGGRRYSHPRPWSLIARKGPHSESSSLHQQELEDKQERVEMILSPTMLPTLFTSSNALSSKNLLRPMSPLSLSPSNSNVNTNGKGFQHIVLPPTPPPEGNLMDDINSSNTLIDFTGRIAKTARFAEAGGGFSDVWKGILKSAGRQELKVAVKVIRPNHADPESGSKMKKRLIGELEVWKTLKHPNILPLYGVTSDFGPYESMVCPWMEHGSVSKYMDKWGDVLSMTDRLQFLCEVAEGLRYLHSQGIVHGDLTGSNILIDNNQRACLCDFGLSSLVAECQGVSHHSTISGAVRWADASLFINYGDGDDEQMPTLTEKSDIYSFGSVSLEILSGRIPYHYFGTDARVIIELHQGKKPRRPAASFVTEAQWEFISKCWHDAPSCRPDASEVLTGMQSLLRASLEFRRHSEPTHNNV